MNGGRTETARRQAARLVAGPVDCDATGTNLTYCPFSAFESRLRAD
jgi:hypothetical protein